MLNALQSGSSVTQAGVCPGLLLGVASLLIGLPAAAQPEACSPPSQPIESGAPTPVCESAQSASPQVPLANQPASPGADGAPSSSASPASKPASPSAAYTVELYAFAPFRTTDITTVQDFKTVTDLTLRDSLSILTWVTSVRASAELGRLGVLTDLSYLQVEEYGTTDVDGIYDLALRYRFGAREAAVGRPGQFTIIPYAGLRVIDQMRGDFVVRTAWQPLLGTQATIFLSPKTRLFAQADLSGSNLANVDDYSGTAQLGIAYAISPKASCNLSWRYLGIDYTDAKSPANGIKLFKNGVELGLKFFF